MTRPAQDNPRHNEFAKARARAQSDEIAQRGRAVRTVAGQAVDEADFSSLLSMLGLEESATPTPWGEQARRTGRPGGGPPDLGRELAGYVRAVAAAVGVPVEATGYEVSDTATAYLGLAQRWSRSPGRDLMLAWDERYGWFVAVETDPAEPPIVLAYLGGSEVVPSPAEVAGFVTGVVDAHQVRRPTAITPMRTDRAELAARLAGHAQAPPTRPLPRQG